MKLLDTSVWIEFLRGVDGPSSDLVVDEAGGSEVAICEPVAMELLSGARDDLAWRRLERLIDGLPRLALDENLDFRSAARLFGAAQRSGRTVRSLTDCLIAAIAIRHGATVIHRDRDYDLIATVSDLATMRLP